jgi:hypothetical protein
MRRIHAFIEVLEINLMYSRPCMEVGSWEMMKLKTISIDDCHRWALVVPLKQRPNQPRYLDGTLRITGGVRSTARNMLQWSTTWHQTA